MIDDIRERIHAQPFVPFTIYVTDGREYHVPTTDHAHVPPNGMRVSVWTDDNRHYILPQRQISGVVATEVPDSPASAN